MDILETARLLRFQTAWERRFHEYQMLLEAGVPEPEAERIASLAAYDRLCTDIAGETATERQAA